MQFSKFAVAALLAAGISTGATAASITQTGSVASTTTDYKLLFSNGSYSAFNTALGTLTSVAVSFTVNATTSGSLVNSSSSSQDFTYTETSVIGIADAGSSAPAQLLSDLKGLTFSSGGVDYTLASKASAAFPVTGTNGFNPGTQTTNLTYTAATVLSQFEGSSFGLDLKTLTGNSFLGGGGNITTNIATTAGGTLTIVYNYDAPPPPPPPTTSVPEPSTMAVLGFGLIGLGFTRRRKAS